LKYQLKYRERGIERGRGGEKEAKKSRHLILPSASHSNPTPAAASLQLHVAKWLELDALAAVDGRGLKELELSPHSLRLSAASPGLNHIQNEIATLLNPRVS
jgi:hypothetical protein